MNSTVDSTNGNPAVLLDRDGVINVKLPEDCYVACYSEFRFLPGVVEALAALRSLGYLLVIVTNQRGIARGLMTAQDLDVVHRAMVEHLRSAGVELDGIYHCPHDRDEGCDCRKPRPGMILRAVRELGIDLARSYMVGDSAADVAAGKSAGAITVRIGDLSDLNADMAFGSLREFADHLSQLHTQKGECRS
jgi:D-glycero-D-manno-heptose 1,7-bisphosphate phosphatase